MPKPNRPLVRDGRLQAKKKRTDRSYLRPGGTPEEAVATEDEAPDEGVAEAVADALTAAEMPASAPVEPHAAFEPAPAAAPRAAVPAPSVASTRTPSSKLPTAVRAIQQQGVRKRREVEIGRAHV